jgi:hypothetical protein
MHKAQALTAATILFSLIIRHLGPCEQIKNFNGNWLWSAFVEGGSLGARAIKSTTHVKVQHEKTNTRCSYMRCVHNNMICLRVCDCVCGLLLCYISAFVVLVCLKCCVMYCRVVVRCVLCVVCCVCLVADKFAISMAV